MGKAVLAHCQQAGTQKVGLLFVKALLRYKKLADKVVNYDRWMGESGIFIFSGEKLADKNSVLIKLHAVGIGKNIDLANITGRVLADIHG